MSHTSLAGFDSFVAGVAADDPRMVGGKAASLSRLRQSGLPIPPWFVVLPVALTQSLDPRGREALSAAHDPSAVAAILDGLHPSPDVGVCLDEHVRQLASGGDLLAVRSSAADEDGTTSSFAGQLESYLFVRPDDVVDRVMRVWRSGYDERVFVYRRERGLPLPPDPPPVIVQRMIAADVSGVAFGADPVTGRRDVVVVSAVPGLGTSLVSGECDADCWHVAADNAILDRVVVRKTVAHRAAPGTVQGVVAVPVEAAASDRPALEEAQVRAVAELVRRCGKLSGASQDVEWAIAQNALWLLQSRPITTLRPETPLASGAVTIWDNSNIAESYSGVTTPLTFSFARHAYEGVYREFCRFMGVRPSAIAANDLAFRRMIGLIRGRVYYNLESWYRTLALLPGFRVNRRFMEQMMGVREGFPDAVLADLNVASRRARLADGVNLARSAAGLAANHLTLPRTTARFYTRLNDALGSPPPPLTTMPAEALASHYYALESRLLKRWDAPLINDFFAMIFHGVMRRLTAKCCGERATVLQNDLLRGEPGMISVEPARLLRRMADIAAARPELIDVLCDGTFAQLEAALTVAPELRAPFEEYVTRFGDRCLEELKLESPTLQDDPLPVLRSIGQLARRVADAPAPDAGAAEISARIKAEAEVRRILAGRPIQRGFFFWILRQARARMRDRENLRFERTRLFGRVRRIFVELGRRFHAAGFLDDPRDIFWLEVDEALGFVDGTATTTDLRDLVRVRKAEFQRHRDAPPPGGRFETRGPVHIGNPFAETAAAVLLSGEEQQGLGCCPGIVRGRARVVRDPKGVRLERGEILVAQRTDPGWVLLFPAAAGLIVQHGSLLSHSAIVARELGLPAVISLPGVTDWLRDGDLVELDGSSGIVRRLARGEG